MIDAFDFYQKHGGGDKKAPRFRKLMDAVISLDTFIDTLVCIFFLSVLSLLKSNFLLFQDKLRGYNEWTDK